jgi:putative transposase
MPRHARLDCAGVLHHVIIRGIERRNIFRNNHDRNDFIERLERLLPETKTCCYAWAFMSNHAHFLFRSGPLGIANLMRRLLTGYVVSFNKRYRRSGQLFQNRYKSIICQEDIYFKELVRYIHLNPVRAKLVSSLTELNRYPYSGHSALMGKVERPWQDTDYTLGFFGSTILQGRRNYRAYVEAGIDQGRREDLTTGGLIRSVDGWKEIGRQAQTVKGDEQILGESDFVLNVLAEAAENLERRYALKTQGCTLQTIAEKVAKLYQIDPEVILSKGRQRKQVEARDLFCYVAVHELRAPVTDLARLIGMTPSAISYATMRGKVIADRNGRPWAIGDRQWAMGDRKE